MKLLADWQHEGPLLALWPYRNDVWRDNARPVQQQLLNMLEAIAPHHPVCLGVHPPQVHSALARLPANLQWFPIGYDDAWVRDTAPLYLQCLAQRTASAGHFNGWQGVNQSHARDQRFARQLASRQRISFHRVPLVFEGGMLTHDGAGTAVVHGCSLQLRNPGKSLAELERVLAKSFGLQRVIWLQHGLGADETSGHVDNQLQFVDSGSIVFAASASDPLWNRELLALQQQPWASDYRWIELPQAQQLYEPTNIYHDVVRHPGVLPRGRRPLLLSYANLISLPQALMVPQFGIEQDAQAVTTLREAFPKLRIMPIDAIEFVRGGGGPHCLTTLLATVPINLLQSSLLSR
ncbi:agmatine deiminase family protein [Pseudidiomarina sp. E22-M8]|uniref:agmatine deiminase family protein n=1 Tax=Pseudidiomarina sp. E22-M8 TaxID=3424768 RepID=UPI00403CF85D